MKSDDVDGRNSVTIGGFPDQSVGPRDRRFQVEVISNIIEEMDRIFVFIIDSK